MKVSSLILAALPAVYSVPTNGGNYCNSINWLIDANHAGDKAATFCSKYLHIVPTTITKLATTTVTGATVTSTCSITSKIAATITKATTVTSIISKQTTSYATSTCTPASNPQPTTTAGSLHKRTYNPDEWCWGWDWPYSPKQYGPAQISAACSCLVTTPTVTATQTSTCSKPGPTTTKTTTATITTSTATVYSSTTTTSTTINVVTMTEIQPYGPTGSYLSPAGAEFDNYSNLDFQRGDLDGGFFCSCDNQGDPNLSDCVYKGVNYGKCVGFQSCENICAGINNNSGNLTCKAVTYNGGDDSGACYFKSSLEGCGIYNDGRRTGLIDLNGYKYASS